MKLFHISFIISLLLISCGEKKADNHETEEKESSQITFNQHVAPIIFENCSGCHRPGEAAPFSFLSYQQVKKHASDIVEVTDSRYMPPWLPTKGDAHFVGTRRLTREQIDTLKRWVEGGALEGDPSVLPPLPEWTTGWQLGKPDLILELPKAYELAADGGDTFRNFVFKAPVETHRFVQAVEFRPGNPAVIHHAWMTVDKTDSCVQRDTAHPEQPGFPGMEMGYSAPPNGHALGWTPGKLPHSVRPEMAWRLESNDDLVLQLHMVPSGKIESVRPTIGLYFSKKPPTLHPYGLQLKPVKIDIPVGEKNYFVKRSFTVPVKASLLSIYPHAHYICAEMIITASLPNGEKKTLLHIPDWDFNWQDLFTLEEAFPLPKDTIIEMVYRYDNSASNPRNPNSPPVRIQEGDRTTDEMGNLWLQLLCEDPTDRPALVEAGLRNAIQACPNFIDLYTLGNLMQKQGKHYQAMKYYYTAIEFNPTHPLIHHNLAGSYAATGQIDLAIESMLESIKYDPNYASARLNLGHFYVRKKDYRAAIDAYRETLKLEPENPVARQNLGKILEALSK